MSEPKPIRILYMEDDSGLARLLQMRLERASYVVDIARDGGEGLAMYDAGSYDVVAVDHSMPVQGGLEVIRALAARGPLPPTIMITGTGNERIAVEAMKLGASDYVVKDVDGKYLDVLPATIGQVLHQKRLEEEKRQAEAALRENGARYRALFDQANDAIFLENEDQEIVDANRRACQLFGYTRQELLSLKASDLVAQGAHHQRSHPIYSAPDQSAQVPFETVGLHREGSHIPIEITIAQLKDGHKNLFLYIVRDVTERKQVEQELTQHRHNLEALVAERTRALAEAYRQLQELDQLKSKFIADISHELRTPVTNIRLYLQLLKRGEPEKRTRYLCTIQAQTDRLMHLIEDILRFSALDLGQEEPDLTPVNLNTWVEPIVATYRSHADAVGLKLIFEPGVDLHPVQIIRDRLTQVVTELLDNAIKYTPVGQVQVSTWQDLKRNRVYLEVRDTGIGIDPQDLPYLFNSFYRGQGVGSSTRPGAGLGLALAKKIVDLHAGEIKVASEAGEGSTFRICLPLTRQKADHGHARQGQDGATAKGGA